MQGCQVGQQGQEGPKFSLQPRAQVKLQHSPGHTGAIQVAGGQAAAGTPTEAPDQIQGGDRGWELEGEIPLESGVRVRLSLLVRLMKLISLRGIVE